MADLTAKDLRTVIDVVYALNDDHGLTEMPNHVLGQLGDLVGCESSFYSNFDRTTGQLLDATSEPAGTDLWRLPGFHAAIRQHPGFAAYHSRRMTPGIPIALTEIADRPSLHRLALYTDYYRPHGTVDQLICLVQRGRSRLPVLAFNRDRCGFSRRDRAVVNLAATHISQAINRRQHLASLTTAVSRMNRHIEQLKQTDTQLSILTPREHQVIEHLMHGHTDREIARKLGISPRTVHKHLEVIYRKLDLNNRTGLIALIHQKRKLAS